MKIEIEIKGEFKNEKKKEVEKTIDSLKSYFLWYQTNIKFTEVKAK